MKTNMKMKMPSCCDSMKNLFEKRLPFCERALAYNAQLAVSDLIAGVTVGLTLIPQSIAYASLAGLKPQYGLYSAFAGSLVYVIFGTCPEINIGPTALMSLLTLTYAHSSHHIAIILCFLCGCVELIAGVCNLGYLTQFISSPVTMGFTSASSVIIASSQVKGLLGIRVQTEGFFDTWLQIFKHIDSVQLHDFYLGIVCCLFLLALKNLNKMCASDGKMTLAKRIVVFVAISRNALAVIVSMLFAYSMINHTGQSQFTLTGSVASGLPAFQLPWLTLKDNNRDLLTIAGELGSGLVILPAIAILENIAIAKTFSNGKSIDATQEMMALGLSNIIASCFSSYPICGSFSRSAVSRASGVATPNAGLYTAALIILTLSLLTPYFYYIPKATLSAIIICAIVGLIELKLLKPMWNVNKIDLVIYILTLLVSLVFSVEYGLVCGILFSLIVLLSKAAVPKLQVNTVHTNGIKYVSIRPMEGLSFPAVDTFRETFVKLASKHLAIVLECSDMHRIDFTVVQTLRSIIDHFQKSNICLVLLHLNENIGQILVGHYRVNVRLAQSDNELFKHLTEFYFNKQLLEVKTTSFDLASSQL